MMSTVLTIQEIADYLQVKPGHVQRWIDDGHLKARRDGLISDRALTAYIKRQQRITRRWLVLYARGHGLPSRKAWAQAVAEENQRAAAGRAYARSGGPISNE